MKKNKLVMWIMKQEFAKKFTTVVLFLFSFLVLASFVVILVKPESSPDMLSLNEILVPVFITLFGYYFGKAGIENFQKIKTSAKSTDSDSEETAG